MQYTFELLGVSPVLYFFDYQQQHTQNTKHQVIEYLGSNKCTLDAFIQSVETVPPTKWGWELEQVINTMISFWVKNADSVQYWQARLKDAGDNTLVIARVSDIKALSEEFEFLLGKN